MTRVLSREEVLAAMRQVDMPATAARAFSAHSRNRAVIPPIGELLLENPPGEVHIKYGYVLDAPYYVVKIASGFSGNPQLGLPTNNGAVLIFSRQNGQLRAVLLDEGILTDHRTAAAGACVARTLAPRVITRIGIVGTGVQAQLQLRYLREVTPCRDVLVWGRSSSSLSLFIDALSDTSFRISRCQDVEDVANRCELIVCATSAQKPLINDLPPGTHLTAVGADTPYKQELHANVIADADIVAVDSLQQCRDRGEVHQALNSGISLSGSILELGQILDDPSLGRRDDKQTTVADLTGIATQDLFAALAVMEALEIDD